VDSPEQQEQAEPATEAATGSNTRGLTDEDGELAVQAAQDLFQTVIESYVQPEIARRSQADDWPNEQAIHRFQIQFPDQGDARTLLNEEVGGVIEVMAARPVKAGEVITHTDFTEINSYTPPEESANVPHITGFLTGDTWFFTYRLGGRDPARHETLEAAREFFATAQDAFAAERLRACVDNATSAVELFAKTELLSCAPTIEFARKSASHRALSAAYNVWTRRLENGDPRFAELLNRLTALRPKARYLERSLDLDDDEVRQLLDLLGEMERHVAHLAEAPLHELPGRYNLIAARPLKAGELVGADASTLFPNNS